MQRSSVVAIVGAVLLGAALVSGGLVAGTALSETAGSPSTAAASDVSASRSISVSATGQAKTHPDKAIVRLRIEATASQPNTARQRVATNVSAVRTALLDRGLNASQIRTVEFNIYSDEERREEGEGSTVYRAQHVLLVEVAALNQTGEIVDTAINAGATGIDGVRYTLSEATRDRLRQQALQNAMGRARTQATTLATESGLAITGVASISTQQERAPRQGAEEAAMAGGGGTEFTAGPVTVVVSVAVQYNATDTTT